MTKIAAIRSSSSIREIRKILRIRCCTSGSFAPRDTASVFRRPDSGPRKPAPAMNEAMNTASPNETQNWLSS